MDVGTIKEMRTEDGQHVATITLASGRRISAIIPQSAGVDSCPLSGDQVLFTRSGAQYSVVAVYTEDAETEAGEWKVFSRNATGEVVASIHLTRAGEIRATPSVKVAGGSDFVALAAKVDAMFALINSIIMGWTPPTTPDSGAALKAAWTTAYPDGKQAVGAQKLKTD